jgi:hypothetical protein
MALQLKYKIGDILEYCQEYLLFIGELIKLLTPLALRAALLMTLSFKMKTISNNYEFDVKMLEDVFIEMIGQVTPTMQEFRLKKELRKESDSDSAKIAAEAHTEEIEALLPKLPEIDHLITKEIKVYSTEDLELLVKYSTNVFLNNVCLSLLPEHRLYLLTLICFYIKSEQKDDFTDLELEFLMRGKYNTNININLADFGVPEKTPVPNWIPTDNWNDLLAMSLLQGELDHFVIAIISNEKEWKAWYESPFKVPMPKVEMEVEKTDKTEFVELNDFRKLILFKVLRPDAYIVLLNEYVIKSLELRITEPSWTFVFQNPLFKTVVVNMGSKSNISNTSSMSRIHKNLFEIAKRNGQKITALNCNFLTLNELSVEIKNVSEGFVLLKNVHLATADVIEHIKNICTGLQSSVLIHFSFFYLKIYIKTFIIIIFFVDKDKNELKWRLILTKSFDYELPSVITSQSTQVSFDVIDIIAHNSVEKNKKINLDTCIVRSETVIFNCKSSNSFHILSQTTFSFSIIIQRYTRSFEFGKKRRSGLIHKKLATRKPILGLLGLSRAGHSPESTNSGLQWLAKILPVDCAVSHTGSHRHNAILCRSK